MQLGDLQTFATVVEAQSVTRAAERLHVVQSAASAAIKRLEAELGVLLLKRERAGVRPTEAGSVLLAHAQVVVNTVDRARRDLAGYVAGERGSVRLGVVHTAVPLLVADLLRRLRASQPNLRLDVHPGSTPELAQLVRQRYLDVALFLLPVNPELLEVKQLAELELSVVLGADHRLAKGGGISLAQLAKEDWISFPQMHPGRMWLEAAAEAAGFRPNVCVEVETLEQLKAFVVAGFGLSLLPRGVCATDAQAGLVYEAPTCDWLPRAKLGLSPVTEPSGPPVRSVVSALEALCATVSCSERSSPY